jgi:hypothetical protein
VVNAKWRLPVAGAHQKESLTCSSLGPLDRKLQRGRNTQFEFVLSGLCHLDKIAVWQHAGEVLHH